MLSAVFPSSSQPWPSTLSLSSYLSPYRKKSYLGQGGGEPIVRTLPIQTHHKYVSWEISGVRQGGYLLRQPTGMNEV